VREDIRSGTLPDKFLCPLLWAGLPINFASILIFSQRSVGAMAGYIGFAVLYWGYRLMCRREGMGYGDVKYLAALGAWHGWCICRYWHSLPHAALVPSCSLFVKA
jgi:leader peptidase HopD